MDKQSKDKKHKLHETKVLVHEKKANKQQQNKIKKEIKHRKAKLDIKNFPIVESGVKTNTEVIEKKMQPLRLRINEIKKELKRAKGKKQKDLIEELGKIAKEYDKLDNQLKSQLKLRKAEIKQIDKLNKYSKGQVRFKNDPKVAIDVRNINKFYTTKSLVFKALDNANLTIDKGSFNVILGPSGSGKTTLLNMISGLDRATYGEVIINGVNIQSLSTKQTTQFRRDNIGFVFQSYNLLPSLNVRDNIEVGRALQADVSKKRDIKDLLKEMDMGSNGKKRTNELSGGQQQRVSIARALSKAPSILIGDEPTGALDTETSLKVFRLFQEINRTQNATVIIVTHNPAVAQLANKVIKVKNGKIDEVIVNKNPKDARKLTEL